MGKVMSGLVWVCDGQFEDAGYLEFLDILGKRYLFDLWIVKVVPFVGEMMPKPDIPEGCNVVHPISGELVANVICFGAYSMRHIARREGWYPGVIDLDCKAGEIYNNSWKDYCLNVGGFISRFDLIGLNVREKGWDEWFMRPIADSKCFAGQVCNIKEYEDWYNGVVLLEEDDGSTLRGTTMCLVAPCIKILKEWRIFVVDDIVVTGSLYKVGGRVLYDRLVDDDVIEFVEGLIVMEPRFADAYVIDIARVESGLKVIEVNTINSAGFYHADVNKLVDALDKKFNI